MAAVAEPRHVGVGRGGARAGVVDLHVVGLHPGRWARSRIWADRAGSRSGSVRWNSGSMSSGESSDDSVDERRRRTPAIASPPQARRPGDQHRRAGAQDRAAITAWMPRPLAEVEQPAPDALRDDPVVAAPGVAARSPGAGRPANVTSDSPTPKRMPGAPGRARAPRAPRPGASAGPASATADRGERRQGHRRRRPSSRRPGGSRGCGSSSAGSNQSVSAGRVHARDARAPQRQRSSATTPPAPTTATAASAAARRRGSRGSHRLGLCRGRRTGLS